MRLAILMSSVAVAALTTPAFAGPGDRYDPGYSCTGMGPQCLQEGLRVDHGSRATENTKPNGINNGINQDGGLSGTSVAARADEDNDGINDDIRSAGNEAGDAISHAANEAGDAISHAADEVGDEIGDAFD